MQVKAFVAGITDPRGCVTGKSMVKLEPVVVDEFFRRSQARCEPVERWRRTMSATQWRALAPSAAFLRLPDQRVALCLPHQRVAK